MPHICVAIFSAYFPSAPNMCLRFQCSFPQCHIYGALQTARSSPYFLPVPQIVVARPHLLSPQRPIYVARHGPISLHVLRGKYQMLSPKYWLSSQLPSSINCSCWNKWENVHDLQQSDPFDRKLPNTIVGRKWLTNRYFFFFSKIELLINQYNKICSDG